jgi:hypothetical protein
LRRRVGLAHISYVKRAIKAAQQAEVGIVAVRHNYDAVADLSLATTLELGG